MEDILYKAHKQGKRKILLKSTPLFRQNHPALRNEDLYQLAYEQLKG
jgi:hypothetical protein